ncbi:hypothetical protein MUP79_02105 [Candidatus Bathyarchaeota archaeon]|nr:hypothetical protein [Candidatus Bathyarchaeota archaeon]
MTRTLIAAGFTITDFRRQPHYGEYLCEQPDVFGATVRYTITIFDQIPVVTDIEYASRISAQDARVFVAVAPEGGSTWIGWNDFIESLGGAVPSWRALSEIYPAVLVTTSQNRLPNGTVGEAWQMFEDAVADGLEYLFGKRVRRLGGHKRGRRSSDILAQTPDSRIIIVDAKASDDLYDVGSPELRPLKEYIETQKTRQRGRLEVGAALLVARGFRQNVNRLNELNGEFISDTRIPISFMEVDTLLHMINTLSRNSRYRNTIQWTRVVCAGGLVLAKKFNQELETAIEQSVH